MQTQEKIPNQYSDHTNATTSARKAYHAPTLTEHGTISEMTQGGAGPAPETFMGNAS